MDNVFKKVGTAIHNEADAVEDKVEHLVEKFGKRLFAKYLDIRAERDQAWAKELREEADKG